MGVDIPEFLAELGRDKANTELVKAVGELTVIAFYYLLKVGKYTIKGRGENRRYNLNWKTPCFPKRKVRSIETNSDQCDR